MLSRVILEQACLWVIVNVKIDIVQGVVHKQFKLFVNIQERFGFSAILSNMFIQELFVKVLSDLQIQIIFISC